MFGFGQKNESLGKEALETLVNDQNTGNKPQIYQGSGFDPEGLERAAKAARELDNSANSKLALEVIKLQKKHKQQLNDLKSTIRNVQERKNALDDVAMDAEEARRKLQTQTEHEKRKTEHNDRLERQRQQELLNAERAIQEEDRRRQHELFLRQEAVRRKTVEYEAELRQQTELARVKAETQGRILQERQNHDLILEQAKVEASEFRDTILQGIKLTGTTIGSAASSFLTDRDQMTSAIITVSGIALGIYTAKMSTGIIGRFIEARLGKPTLVRETSRRTFGTFLKNPIKTVKAVIESKRGEDALKGVILEPQLEERLRRISVSTMNTKKNGAPFRHLLLYGPPGTGKTLFAKGLARHSGLEYAILTGGDIVPLGRQAVTELHKLFDWANTSKKGLLLFVDEADAFLRKRSTEGMSEDLRNALNAFLYRTGTETKKFMVVYASNQPDLFDWAINDRIDEMVEFPLPNKEERFRMIDHYLQMYLLNPQGKKAKKIFIEDIEEKDIEEIVNRTENFSGREIAKLAIAWQSAAFGTKGAAFTREMLYNVLNFHIKQKQQKIKWIKNDQLSMVAKKKSI